MNTKITFSCANVTSSGIRKIIFEAITDEDIIDDAIGWVDNNVDYHYNEFDLDFVLEWNVVSCVETEEDVKDSEIINTINGHLFFEDSIDWSYYRIGKAKFETSLIKKETRKIKKETKILNENTNRLQPPRKKDYPSVWIDNIGETHYLNFAEHESFASDWLKENEPEIFELKYSFNRETKYALKYAYEILQDLGWIRILGWADPPNFVITNRVTPKQKQALKDYCLNNKVPYHAFPEILKS